MTDLPGDPDVPETGILRTGADTKETRHNYNNKLKEVKSDAAPRDMKSLTIALGVTAVAVVVVVVLTGAALCVRRRSRQKQDDYTPTWRSMFGNKIPMMRPEGGATVKISESRDVDQMQLEIRRLDGSQPDIIAQASPKPTHADKCRSPLDIRKQAAHSPKKCPNEVTMTPNTIQKRAWERMLMTQQLESDEAESESRDKSDELTPIMDLPPPPQFLLDNNDDTHQIQPDSVSYHDILDGYHSEENIDDGEHFEIRLPQENGHNNNNNNNIHRNS